MDLTAIIVPKVTCDLPLYPVPFSSSWNHFSDIPLADATFGQPGHIDLLLGVDVFVDVLLHGRWNGPPGSPVAIETKFGWMLSGSTDPTTDLVNLHVTTFTSTVLGDGDYILRNFWEIEESPIYTLNCSHLRNEQLFDILRRDIVAPVKVPLQRKPDAQSIGESRSQAVRRFFALERQLINKNQFPAVNSVIQEYFEVGYAEAVPPYDLEKDTAQLTCWIRDAWSTLEAYGAWAS